MGDSFPVIDILLFAMVAVFLFLRLRSVLGRRTGHEQQRPNPFSVQDAATRAADRPAADSTVVPFPGRVTVEHDPSVPVPLAIGMKQVREADPSFSEADFLDGARQVFPMIAAAFAKGDLATLRTFLADAVYGGFARAVEERQRQGHTLETEIVELPGVDLYEARMDGRLAAITVRYASRQISVTRDAEGRVIDGNPNVPDDLVDLWTFVRDVRSSDPNWQLAATRVPE
ncbi:MAG: Tim44 domain-containing protein [Alphaproteobacteria bacterium]|nr:MAG: Tim44 domain-containing protein [Alphaproteobacteria bacterium]